MGQWSGVREWNGEGGQVKCRKQWSVWKRRLGLVEENRKGSEILWGHRPWVTRREKVRGQQGKEDEGSVGEYDQ